MALPAEKLVEGCYLNMFMNCKKLEGLSVSFADWNDPVQRNLSTLGWLIDANASGKFIVNNKDLDVNVDRGSNTIPSGWTIQGNVLVTGIELSEQAASIVVGDTLTLTATAKPEYAADKTVTWRSSDETVATVDENGLVTAVAVGTATITAKANDGSDVEASCAVTVSPILVTSITLSAMSMTIGLPDTLKVTDVMPANATDKTVTWSSDNEQVATVDQNGVITPEGVGYVTITAKANDGSNKTAFCNVTVSDDVQLWENGPYFARCNVGATKIYESGYYFWWGDTVGYKRNAANDGWVAVNDEMTSITFYSTDTTSGATYSKTPSALTSAGYTSPDGNLVAGYDAARQTLGSTWRMMTVEELESLTNNCDWRWITVKGVPGYAVTGKGAYAGNSIFLPAAGNGSRSDLKNVGDCGFYWSSTAIGNNETNADKFSYDLSFSSQRITKDKDNRFTGFSIRAVR